MPLDANEGFDGRTGRTPGGEEGEVIIGDVVADQQSSGPCAGRAVGVFVGLEIGEFEIGPITEAFAFGALAGRQAMFKILILAAQNTVSDVRMAFLIRDPLSWLRFPGFDPGAPTPDENTIRLFHEKLTRAGAIDTLFAAFDRSLRERGYLPLSTSLRAGMRGQIVDATLVAAPKQRNTAAERQTIKAGRTAAEIWPNEPARAAQKDTDARWTLKFAKARMLPDGRPGIDIAIPGFGYESSIAIYRRYGFIRRGKVTDGARFDGRMLRDVVTRDNTASDVWADTAYAAAPTKPG